MFQNRRTSIYVISLLLIFGVVGFLLNQSVFADFEEAYKVQINKILRVAQLVN
jgi:hypothetical protein